MFGGATVSHPAGVYSRAFGAMGAGASAGGSDEVTDFQPELDSPLTPCAKPRRMSLRERRDGKPVEVILPEDALFRRKSEPLPSSAVAGRNPPTPATKTFFRPRFPSFGGGGSRRQVKVLINSVSRECFNAMYELGGEFVPCTHQGMQLLRAVRLRDSLPVVIKVISKVSFRDAEEEDAWRQNTEFFLNLPKSGRVAQLFEVIECESFYYVVMEEVDGLDLFETLDFEGMLPVEDIKDIVREIITGVAELHERGLIHKDIKLENVMVRRASDTGPSNRSGFSCSGTQTPSTTLSEPDGSIPQATVVKLIDFDTLDQWSPKSPPARKVVGTDQYIAHEAYAGRYSPASDIFAVGVVAYRLLTGFFPFCPALFDDAGESYVGSPKMKQMQRRLQRAEVDWGVPPFDTDSEALDFCRPMLAKVESDRPTAVELLEHPFLSSQ